MFGVLAHSLNPSLSSACPPVDVRHWRSQDVHMLISQTHHSLRPVRTLNVRCAHPPVHETHHSLLPVRLWTFKVIVPTTVLWEATKGSETTDWLEYHPSQAHTSISGPELHQI